MEIRENEIKSQLLDKKALLLARANSENYGTFKTIIDVIDWLLNTFCKGNYVILDKNKLGFLFKMEDKSTRGNSNITKITMDVIAGHQVVCTSFTQNEICNNEELKEQIKKYAIEQWIYDNAF